jgi:hypothetical protein
MMSYFQLRNLAVSFKQPTHPSVETRLLGQLDQAGTIMTDAGAAAVAEMIKAVPWADSKT